VLIEAIFNESTTLWTSLDVAKGFFFEYLQSSLRSVSVDIIGLPLPFLSSTAPVLIYSTDHKSLTFNFF